MVRVNPIIIKEERDPTTSKLRAKLEVLQYSRSAQIERIVSFENEKALEFGFYYDINEKEFIIFIKIYERGIKTEEITRAIDSKYHDPRYVKAVLNDIIDLYFTKADELFKSTFAIFLVRKMFSDIFSKFLQTYEDIVP